MKTTIPTLAAMTVCGLCVLGIVVLAALGQAAPDVLTYLATVALGAGAGTALPGRTDTATTTDTAPAASSAARALPPVPAPVPLTSEPATGVFRAATHAP